jgi:acetyl esterase
MSIDAQAQWVLDAVAQAQKEGQPKYEDGDAETARRLYRDARGALSPDPPEVAECRDLAAPGPAGDIPVRYYRPAGSAVGTALPTLVYYHGGGWVIGDLDTHDVICRGLANAGAFAVVSVDYRLAPEHPFPAAVEDAVAAVRWLADGNHDLAIDRGRIAVGGDSAGGNLAAVVCLACRNGGPAISAQMLIYPATDMHRDTASHRQFGAGHLLTAPMQDWFRAQYVPEPTQWNDWQVSPLLADDHAGLPPAHVLTAGCDPLRDEGKAYADTLKASGVAVDYVCVDGQIHGFLTMGRVIDAAGDAVTLLAEHLATVFEESGK